jgi:hypothetical protein
MSCRWIAGVMVWLTTYAVLTLLGYGELIHYFMLVAIDNSHYRLILKLGTEMQVNHHS